MQDTWLSHPRDEVGTWTGTTGSYGCTINESSTMTAEQRARFQEQAGQPDGERWSGEWVERRLGVRLPETSLRDLLGLALRRNPRRAQLLVSRVLGEGWRV